MKRLIALIVTLALCLTLFPAALAQESITARTSLDGASAEKISNLEIAIRALDGRSISSGARFSFNDAVGPRTRAYGYQVAENGRGVRVTGGGVAQAASTLYLALKDLGDAISFEEKKTYGSKFAQDYVEDSSDAILVDYSSGVDFAFTNYGDDLTIGMWMTEDYLYCTLTPHPQEESDSIFMDWAPINPSQSFFSAISSASIPLDDDEALRNNLLLAASSINDTVLNSGDLFSFNDSVGPRSEKYGYVTAINGRGVQVTGGGVAQVASVIWLAVKGLDCVAIVEKSTYGSRYNQDYVESSNDAILTDYKAGTDFSFRNTGSEPLTIATYLTDDALVCEIYQG